MSQRYSLASLVGLSVLVVAWLVFEGASPRSRGSLTPSQAQERLGADAMAPEGGGRRRAPARPLRLAHPPAFSEPPEPVAAAQPGSRERSGATSLSEAIREAAEAKYHPVPSWRTRQALRRILSDGALIDSAAEELLRTDTGLTAGADLDRRLQIVRFLAQALRWQENPEREGVLASVLRVIEQPLDRGVARALRRSMAGDKIELIRALGAHAPDVLEALAASAPGSDNERLIAFGLARLATPSDWGSSLAKLAR